MDVDGQQMAHHHMSSVSRHIWIDEIAEIDLPEAIKFKSDASTNSRLRPGSLCPWPRALGPWPRARGVVLVLPLKLIVSGRSIAKCINSHGRPK